MSSTTSPTQRLREALPALRGPARRLAEHILGHPAESARASVTALASACEVAPSTVSRLAARLGYEGFPDLRAALATEHGRALQSGWERDIGTEVGDHDAPQQLLDVLASAQHRAARAGVTSLDAEVAAQAADAIVGARRVLLHGTWADAVPLEELRLRLLRLGLAVWLHADRTAALIAAESLAEGDVVVALSRGGTDPHAAEALTRARTRGARTVLITGAPDSALADLADHVLDTGVRSTTWTEIFAGRASDTLACSLLWLLVAQRMPDALGRLRDLT